MTTFSQHIKDGVRFAYVYHIAGYDWAATTDPDFAAWYNAQGTEAAAYGGLMFGSSSNAIQMLPVLNHDLGAQTITSTREGGIDVGQWSVSVNGDTSGYKFGKLFPYVPFSGWQSGLLGLNWEPDATQPEIKRGIMSKDLRLSRVTGDLLNGLAPGFLYWRTDQDFGLSDYLTTHLASSPIIWAGSSCMVVVALEVDGVNWKATVYSGVFCSPLEDLVYSDSMRYQITTVPLDMAGRTSRLFAVPISVIESVSVPT
jgi:hypothetical protein